MTAYTMLCIASCGKNERNYTINAKLVLLLDYDFVCEMSTCSL